MTAEPFRLVYFPRLAVAALIPAATAGRLFPTAGAVASLRKPYGWHGQMP